VRGVVAAGAEKRITLYTGNDDHIVLDLVTPFTVMRDGQAVTVRIRGGLLGHWSVWTRAAVSLFERCRTEADKLSVTADLMARLGRLPVWFSIYLNEMPVWRLYAAVSAALAR